MCMALRIAGSIFCLKYVGILNIKMICMCPYNICFHRTDVAVQDSICSFKYNEIHKAIYNLNQALLSSLHTLLISFEVVDNV